MRMYCTRLFDSPIHSDAIAGQIASFEMGLIFPLALPSDSPDNVWSLSIWTRPP